MKLFIAMPSFSGRPDIETVLAFSQDLAELQSKGIDLVFKPYCGNSIIPMVRNQITQHFLDSDCTHLIMLDDDISWETGALLRLLSHDCDVVGGAYPKRQDKLEFPVKRCPGATVDQQSGLLEVFGIPGGFIKISRSCLEAMDEHYADLRTFDRNVQNKLCTGVWHYGMWPGVDKDSPPDIPELWGEDFAFCKRWRDMGGKVYLDTLLTFGHAGRKAWRGCYAETMPIAALFEHA